MDQPLGDLRYERSGAGPTALSRRQQYSKPALALLSFPRSRTVTCVRTDTELPEAHSRFSNTSSPARSCRPRREAQPFPLRHMRCTSGLCRAGREPQARAAHPGELLKMPKVRFLGTLSPFPSTSAIQHSRGILGGLLHFSLLSLRLKSRERSPGQPPSGDGRTAPLRQAGCWEGKAQPQPLRLFASAGALRCCQCLDYYGTRLFPKQWLLKLPRQCRLLAAADATFLHRERSKAWRSPTKPSHARSREPMFQDWAKAREENEPALWYFRKFN